MSRLPGKRARPVLRGLRRGDAPELPDWRIWFYVLEAAGLSVQLVNARDVKNVPGRPKTSSTRCGWPSSPRRACCGRVSCRPRRSGSCVTTPGCGSI